MIVETEQITLTAEEFERIEDPSFQQLTRHIARALFDAAPILEVTLAVTSDESGEPRPCGRMRRGENRWALRKQMELFPPE